MKLSGIISRIKGLGKKTVSLLCRALPLQNMVVFNSFHGRGMADDPKYIALELLRRNTRISLVWLVKDAKRAHLPAGILPVEYDSLKASFYMSLARVWVDNCRDMADKAMKRKGQFYIQTWHATLGLKKKGPENTKSSKRARAKAIADAAATDLMYSDNDVYVDFYKNKFWFQGTVLKCDQPRVAYLFNHPEGLKAELCARLGIPTDTRIAMYAPTFRDRDVNGFEVYDYDFERILQALEKVFGSGFTMLVRLHPNIRNSPALGKFKFSPRVVDATFMPDMQELLCIADVLITDFSSSMFDFAICRKPVFLVAKDYERYVADDRELFVDPRKDLPFSFSDGEDELIAAIKSFDPVDYRKACDGFFDSVGLRDQGRGDLVLADLVESKMKSAPQSPLPQQGVPR